VRSTIPTRLGSNVSTVKSRVASSAELARREGLRPDAATISAHGVGIADQREAIIVVIAARRADRTATLIRVIEESGRTAFVDGFAGAAGLGRATDFAPSVARFAGRVSGIIAADPKPTRATPIAAGFCSTSYFEVKAVIVPLLVMLPPALLPVLVLAPGLTSRRVTAERRAQHQSQEGADSDLNRCPS
jgi:hypothetical protein